jgi:excisionase family DNA binding protein
MEHTFESRRFVGVTEMARVVGVSPDTVKAWCQAYGAPYLRVGLRGSYRFDPDAFLAWMERQTPRQVSHA